MHYPGTQNCPYRCFLHARPTFVVATEVLAMEGATPAEATQPGQSPPTPAFTTPTTLVELAVDGQKQLHTVVEAAHDILLSLNRALCSPSFWVAPSLQTGNAAESGEAANDEKASDSSAEGLAALDATRVRYKSATGALRATVTAIVKQSQVVRLEGEGGAAAADDVDTEMEYLERRAADLREEVERKNVIVKLHMNQLRTLVADIFMWQTTGF